MAAGLKRGFNETLVFLALGALLMIGSFGLGWVLIFADATLVPLGNLGKFVIVIVTLTLNGFLVVIIAEQRKKIKAGVSKLTP